MSLQLVFVDCQPVDHLVPHAGRVHTINNTPASTLSSPRLDFMADRPLLFSNADVLFLKFTETTPTDFDLFAFMVNCRPSSSCRNRFYLGTIDGTRVPFDELLAKADVYIPVSGLKMPATLIPGWRLVVKTFVLQGAHVLYEWSKRRLLHSTKIASVQSGVIMETECSKGNHFAVDKEEGWLWNTSTPFIGLLIDYYRIDSSFAGPNSQLNFTGDAEFRLKVASYLFDVLRSFVAANGPESCETETVDHVLSALAHIFPQPANTLPTIA